MKKPLISILILLFQLSVFSSVFAQFSAVEYGALAWADYNNDGFDDLLLTGNNVLEGRISKIYKNNGDSTFTEQTQIELPGVQQGSVDWGDYNNDGFLDILLTGKDNDNNRLSKIFSNNGDGTFSEQTLANLTPVSSSSVAWSDYDKDGNLDILLTGYNSGGISKLYKNNGDSTFTEQTVGLLGVYHSSVAWSDFNKDTWPDILLTGRSGNAVYSVLYKNNQDGTFTELPLGLGGVMYSSVSWGDYNDDTWPDMLITGYDGGIVSRIYSNNGDETFSELTEDITGNITGVRYSSVAWGDYNNDGYDDILLTGDTLLSPETPMSIIYRNNGDSTFSKLQTKIQNVYVGSAIWCDYNNDNYLDYIISGISLNSNITKLYSNNQSGNFTLLEKGLDFTPFITFEEIENVELSSVTWEDYNKDGYQDFILTGATDDVPPYNPVSKIYKNNGNGTFSEQTSINLPGVHRGSVAWGDYNNDTYPDFIITGGTTDSPNYTPISKIYKNNQNGTFSEQTQFTIPEVALSSVQWGDYNNDNYPDLLINGTDASGRITKVYKNNNGSSFTDIGAGLTESNEGSVEWGDFNNDNLLDILITGWSNSGRITKIYENKGNDIFEDLNTGLPGIKGGKARWGDYNNDGFLDIALFGSSSSVRITKIYKNNGNKTFTEEFSFPGLIDGDIAWLDYDNDNYVDILLTAFGSGVANTKIYKNDGGTSFIEQTQIELQDVYNGSVDCADFNNDNLKDILLTGEVVQGVDYVPFSSVYINTGNNNFNKLGNDFPPLTVSYISIADYNKDKNKDIVLTGKDSDTTEISKIYEAVDLVYQEPNTDLPVYRNACSSWGDYNNDGYLDLIICGLNSLDIPETKLLTNSVTGKFTETFSLITGVYDASIEWADYNNDGLLDFIISGNNGTKQITKIYKNTGGNFIENSTVLPGSIRTVWSDYNNDQLWDILLIDSEFNVKVYQNKGNDIFEQTFQYLNAYYSIKDISFSDYNNDGFDDILMLAKYYNSNAAHFIYSKNLTNGNFDTPAILHPFGVMDFSTTNKLNVNDFNFDGKSDILLNNLIDNNNYKITIFYNDTTTLGDYLEIPGTQGGNIGWDDLDNDTDLDFLVTGVLENDTVTKIFYNQGTETNSKPSHPEGLSFECRGDTVFLNWDKAPDTDETPQNSFTYNCYIYEVGGDTIWHPSSDIFWRKIYFKARKFRS